MVSDIRNRGFSLIELLVVSAVILSITGLVVVNYTSYSDTQKLKQAGRTLKNDLRFIQTRSASGVKPTGCATLLAYRITFASSTYSYQPYCTGGVAGTVQTVTLPSNVTFLPPIPSTLDVQVLTGAFSRTGTLRLSAQGKQYAIQVTQNGDVDDLGFQ